jgi:hypothetical protein
MMGAQQERDDMNDMSDEHDEVTADEVKSEVTADDLAELMAMRWGRLRRLAARLRIAGWPRLSRAELAAAIGAAS